MKSIQSKTLILALTAAVASSALTAAPLRKLEDLTLIEGSTSEIPSENAVTIRSSNGSVVSVGAPDGTTANIAALQMGRAELTYFDALGPRASRIVMVVPTYWPILQTFFEDDPEVSISVSGDRVIISGVTAQPDTLRRARQAQSFDAAGRIVNQVTSTTSSVADLVAEYLRELGRTNIVVAAVGNEICLSGKLYDAESIKLVGNRVKEFLKDFNGIGVNTDGLKVIKQRISLSVELLQYNVNKARNLGLKTPDQVTGIFNAKYEYNDDRETLTRAFTSDVGINDVRVAVNLLKQNNVGKTVYHTTLATQSGEEAEFQNGGTIHRNTAGAYTSDLKEIEYGFIVKAKPVIIDAETMTLDIALDNKSPNGFDGSSTRDIDVKRYQTHSKYVVRPGETIALSGFNQETQSQTKDGTPFLSHIPLLGRLFQNVSESQADTEMALIVTVNWVTEDETGAAKALRDRLHEKKAEIEAP